MEEQDKKARSALASGFAMNRRDLIQRAAALGAVGGLMGTTSLTSAFAADYDPKKYAGTKISILMTGDENDHRALADLLPEFEAETGMTLEITSPALGPLIEKTLQNLKAPQSSFEIINYLGLPHHAAGRGRLFRAAQRAHRQPGRDAARLGLRRLHPGRDGECRLLRHEDRHGR